MARLRTLALLLLGSVVLSAHAGDPFNGHTLYGKYCLSCHGDSGSGEMSPIPDFSRGEGLLQPDLQIAETLKRGTGAMPAYQGLLSDNELADVITYIRTLQ